MYNRIWVFGIFCLVANFNHALGFYEILSIFYSKFYDENRNFKYYLKKNYKIECHTKTLLHDMCFKK